MSEQNLYKEYAEYRVKQTELADILQQASAVIDELNMKQMGEILKRLSQKVQNETFKVQIVGTFKNGKSTFINSLLGEEILPAYALPCTAIVNEVKWCDNKKAIVHFRNPLPEKLPSGIPVSAIQHMKKHNMKNIPPIEIPYDEIEKYAVISIGHGKEEIDYESPYEKIEVFWPLPILKNGVQIIDSPGLNECATRTRVTMNYITKADAILFVLDATRILSADEMRVIEHTLKEQGFDDPFIIVNKFDAIRAREKEPMRQYVRDKLDGFTTNDFFFVSALNALDGKLDDDEDMLKSSGMIEFENALSHYLTKQKGRAKLSQPTREVKRVLKDEVLQKSIPMQRSALASSLDSLKEKYEKAKPRLELLRVRKEQILSRLNLKIDQTKPDFKRLITTNINDLTDAIPAWIDEYQTQTQAGLLPNKDLLATVYQEIATHLNQCIEDSQTQWRKTVLEPVISEKTGEIFSDLEKDLENFFNEIDRISSDLTGCQNDNIKESLWQRVSSSLADVSLGNVNPAMSEGVKDMSNGFAKGFALEIGAISLLGVFGMLNPVTIVASLVALFFYSSGKSQGVAIKKLKDQICAESINHLNENKLKSAEEIADTICEKLSDLALQLTNVMDVEITETENQVNAIIEEMEKGKENIRQKEVSIKRCEDSINNLIAKLDDLNKRIIET